MQKFADRGRRLTGTLRAFRAFLVTLLVVVGVAGCGSSLISPAPIPEQTVGPAASQNPSAEPSTPLSSPSSAATSPIPSAAGADFQACALLSGAELSKIIGTKGVQPRPMPSDGWMAGQCAWNGPASGFFVSVGTAESISGFNDPVALDAKAKLAQYKAQMGAPGGAKDLRGIGDAAVLTAVGLAAYKDGTYLQLTNLGLTEEQLISIAKLAVARL
jgi:hypothetical protein